MTAALTKLAKDNLCFSKEKRGFVYTSMGMCRRFQNSNSIISRVERRPRKRKRVPIGSQESYCLCSIRAHIYNLHCDGKSKAQAIGKLCDNLPLLGLAIFCGQIALSRYLIRMGCEHCSLTSASVVLLFSWMPYWSGFLIPHIIKRARHVQWKH